MGGGSAPATNDGRLMLAEFSGARVGAALAGAGALAAGAAVLATTRLAPRDSADAWPTPAPRRCPALLERRETAVILPSVLARLLRFSARRITWA